MCFYSCYLVLHSIQCSHRKSDTLQTRAKLKTSLSTFRRAWSGVKLSFTAGRSTQIWPRLQTTPRTRPSQRSLLKTAAWTPGSACPKTCGCGRTRPACPGPLLRGSPDSPITWTGMKSVHVPGLKDRWLMTPARLHGLSTAKPVSLCFSSNTLLKIKLTEATNEPFWVCQRTLQWSERLIS